MVMLKKCLYKETMAWVGLVVWVRNSLLNSLDLSCKAWIELRPANTTVDIFLAFTLGLQIVIYKHTRWLWDYVDFFFLIFFLCFGNLGTIWLDMTLQTRFKSLCFTCCDVLVLSWVNIACFRPVLFCFSSVSLQLPALKL